MLCGEGSRSAREGRPCQSPSRRSLPFLPKRQAGIPYPNSTQRLRVPRAPNSSESGVPAPTYPQSSIPRTRASGPPFLLPSKSSIQVLSFQGPWRLRTSNSSQSSQGRGCGSTRAAGPQGGGTYRSGADPGTRGLPRAPAPAPAAGSAGRGGAGSGNRLDNVTPAGERRVPEGRGSRSHLKHLGTCSPGGAGRRPRRSHSESPEVHFTDRKGEAQKPRATWPWKQSPDFYLSVAAEDGLLTPCRIPPSEFPTS